MVMDGDEPTRIGADDQTYVGCGWDDTAETLTQKIVAAVASRFDVDPRHVTIF